MFASVRPASSARRRAFTLIELLTVIAIIGVLVALTLTTVRSVRQSAKKAQNMSNLRQLGQAALLYAADNKGGIVPLRRGSTEFWYTLLYPYLHSPSRSSNTEVFGVWASPFSTLTNNVGNGAQASINSHYGKNRYLNYGTIADVGPPINVGGSNFRPVHNWTFLKITEPSKIFLFGDAAVLNADDSERDVTRFIGAYENGRMGGFSPRLPNGRSHVVYADMHVGEIDPRDTSVVPVNSGQAIGAPPWMPRP